MIFGVAGGQVNARFGRSKSTTEGTEDNKKAKAPGHHSGVYCESQKGLDQPSLIVAPGYLVVKGGVKGLGINSTASLSMKTRNR
jgi:hypothetical protein